MEKMSTVWMLSAAVIITLMMSMPAISSAETLEAWEADFDKVCGSELQDSDISADKLMSFYKETDGLQTRLDVINHAQKKVFMSRLMKCKALIKFLLDLKTAK